MLNFFWTFSRVGNNEIDLYFSNNACCFRLTVAKINVLAAFKWKFQGLIVDSCDNLTVFIDTSTFP